MSSSLRPEESGTVTDPLDVAAIERAERDLDAFVNKRSKEREEANAEEELWRVSERRHRRKARIANGHAWVEYYEHLAHCHEQRAEEYRNRSRKASELVAALADEVPGPEAA